MNRWDNWQPRVIPRPGSLRETAWGKLIVVGLLSLLLIPAAFMFGFMKNFSGTCFIGFLISCSVVLIAILGTIGWLEKKGKW